MSVYLNGIGMCTSLGMTRAETHAQYLAREKAFFKDPKVIGVDGMPVRYAPVFPVRDILNMESRLQKLIEAAVTDLISQVPETDRQAQVVLHLPSWMRDDPFGSSVNDWPVFADWTPDRFDVVWNDQMSFAKALVLGLSALQSNPTRDVVLVSVDTFLSAELLDFLTLQDRILHKGQPHGMVPSEAAVALRITAEDRVQFDAVLGWIDGHWEGQETQDVKRPTDMLGDVLAEVMRAGTNHAPIDRLLIDANGERWRSEEMSMAFARATNISDEIAADFEAPSSQLGYCGGTMGAVMVGLAMGQGYDPVPPGQQTERQFISTSTFIGQRDGLGLVRDARQEAVV